MGCTNCVQTTASITGYVPSYCQPIQPCSTNCNSDASGVIYSGPALSCSGVSTGTTLDKILQTFDPLLCAAVGDYSTYNTACLAPITTQKQFVESISAYVCNTQAQLTTFTGTTFPNYQAAVNTRFVAIEVPGITCDSASVVNTDTLQTVLSKYCTKFGDIDTALDVSGANWTSCYTVNPLPSNLTEAFNTLISQICLLKTLVNNNTNALPVFNNLNSCLPTPGAADTLVSTINQIKTRLCQTGTISTTSITWGCVSVPNGDQNLQDSIQNIVSKVTSLSQSAPIQWSADFTVTNVDNGDLCQGKRIALAVPSSQDRYVAATNTDLTPGTLQQKLVAGTNISLDFSTPTQVTINSTGGSGIGDHKVLADSTDTVPNYLFNKVEIGPPNSGLSIIPNLDTTNTSHQVSFQVGVDLVALFTALLQAVQTDSGLMALFCQTVAACPSPCAPPSNITVTYSSGGTTTSTTTTTTTTSSGTSTTTSTSTSTSTSSSTSTSTTTSSTSSTSSTTTTSTSSHSTTTTSTSSTSSTTSTSTSTSSTSSTSSTTSTSTSTTSTSTSSTSSTTSTSTSSTTSTSTSTSSTTSTSTSSTTSTSTTTPPAATIYTGAQASSTPPNSAAVAAGNTTLQVPSGNVNSDFTPFNATPQYCWCAIPQPYTKTKWYDTAIDNGNIGGPTDLFTIATTVVISAVTYNVYMTQYATQFAESTQFQP